MITLSDLKKMGRYLHELPFPEQVVVVQNTVCELWGDVSNCTAQGDVSIDELRRFYMLASHNDYRGPLLSTYFEGGYAWCNYLQYGTPQRVIDALEAAVSGNWWLKYAGLLDYDPHLAGQVVHSLCVLLEGWPEIGVKRSISATPGLYIPSYQYALTSLTSSVRMAIVIGAFSVRSVADIWAIKTHLLRGIETQIFDVTDGLSNVAAGHYGIPFNLHSGLDTELAKASVSLVLTDHLFEWLGGYEELPDLRSQLFVEAYRVLHGGGRLVMIEMPFTLNGEGDPRTLKNRSKRLLCEQLTLAGFSTVEIRQPWAFPFRTAVEGYLMNGHYDLSQVRVAREKSPHLIIATK